MEPSIIHVITIQIVFQGIWLETIPDGKDPQMTFNEDMALITKSVISV